MNFLKRAFCSMRYRFRKGFLLVLAFSVAFFLVLTGFSMLQGADHSAETMRSRYRAAVGIYDFSTRSYSVRDQNLISAETVEHLANHPLVEACHPFYYSSVRSGDLLRPWVQEEQAQAFGDNSNLRVIGTAQPQAAPEFATGNNYLVEGEFFAAGESACLMMSVDLAERNGVQIGDKVPLFTSFMTNGGENITATLVGIYGIETYLPHTQSPYFNSENLLYVTPDVAQTLNGPACNAYSVTCVVEDPEQAAAFVEDIQNMGLPEGEDLRFIIDDGQYRAVRNAIEATTRIAWAMLVASLTVTCVVLVLLTRISLRSREYEIGVLLSLGESRGKIYGQMLLESLVPVLAACFLALCLAPLSQAGIIWLLQDSQAQVAAFTLETVAALFASGALLVLFASLITAHKIRAYQPKKILLAAG